MVTGVTVRESQHGKSFKDAKLCNISFVCNMQDNQFEFNNLLDLSGVDFTGAELEDVHFRYCDLRGAKFDNTKFVNVDFYRCAFDIVMAPDGLNIAQFYKDGIRVYGCLTYIIKYGHVGTFNSADMYYPIETDGEELTGYKKVMVGDLVSDIHYAIAKLRIPAYADRIVYEDDKCRASCAQVVDIYDENDIHYDGGSSMYYPTVKCEYRPKHMVYSDSFDDNPFEVCSHGIHFFLTEQEAWDYI